MATLLPSWPAEARWRPDGPLTLADLPDRLPAMPVGLDPCRVLGAELASEHIVAVGSGTTFQLDAGQLPPEGTKLGEGVVLVAVDTLPPGGADWLPPEVRAHLAQHCYTFGAGTALADEQNCFPWLAVPTWDGEWAWLWGRPAPFRGTGQPPPDMDVEQVVRSYLYTCVRAWQGCRGTPRLLGGWVALDAVADGLRLRPEDLEFMVGALELEVHGGFVRCNPEFMPAPRDGRPWGEATALFHPLTRPAKSRCRRARLLLAGVAPTDRRLAGEIGEADWTHRYTTHSAGATPAASGLYTFPVEEDDARRKKRRY